MKKGLNAFHLKLLAITAMFINHLGHVLNADGENLPLYLLTEVIGRLAFPIMAYLLVQGFQYSRNKERYALRLTVFWLLSILPFHYLFYPERPIFPFNNILCTLLLGLLLLMLLERVSKPLLQHVLIFLFACLSWGWDWGFVGILLIASFYQYRQRQDGVTGPIVSLTLTCAALFLCSFLLYQKSLLLYDMAATFGLLLTIPLLKAYNGRRGYCPAWVKWGFYAFYPGHLCLLLLLRFLILKS
ncbi:hypothetical protein STRDD11_02691 [Streptococcus sp. DD11]|uniref:TraX family protein n=1 Tax=Streptococcus sp. DD11 TaxID=1777879 RepID=UPI000798F663|nr:TraX family protein [Streptococcus sp. DD11]KXT77211.1 hypothetical protein STRDD11_02691 [Streptococcus sp. DD11]